MGNEKGNTTKQDPRKTDSEPPGETEVGDEYVVYLPSKETPIERLQRAIVEATNVLLIGICKHYACNHPKDRLTPLFYKSGPKLVLAGGGYCNECGMVSHQGVQPASDSAEPLP